MTSIRSYVVRIYRSGRVGITGVVEDVKTGRTRPFSSINELWQGLQQRPARSAAPDGGDLPPPSPGNRSEPASD